MKNISFCILIAITITLTHNVCTAQNEPVEGVRVIARATRDSIILRWAPTTAMSWKLLNNYGYKIERFTIARDGKVLEEKPATILAEIHKPRQVEAWEAFIDSDDYVAIAAQAIYGDDFEVSQRETEGLSVVSQAQELTSRYSFTLFAADMSIRASMLAGLRFVDRDVKQNERYLYRVHSLVPSDIRIINSGIIYVGPGDARPLTQPKKPELQFGDQVVSISWDTYGLSDSYTAYNIEKSVDGTVFKKVNKLPLSAVSQSKDDTRITISDSLSSNDATVHYRIVGLTPFGDAGPPSAVSSGTGVPALYERAVITERTVIANTVLLAWTFSRASENLIMGFEIERSSAESSGYRTVSVHKPDERQFTDQKPAITNYYRIASLTKAGDKLYSFPILVQLEDSIPPATPIGLRAEIDSTGQVSLTWAKNTESDLLGYRLYRSYFKNSEFSLINEAMIAGTQYTEKINIRTLTPRVFYKISALDLRHNPSAYSTAIEVQLPDIIPPVPPVFTNVQHSDDSIQIDFSMSPSADVTAYHLYRIAQRDTVLLKTFRVEDPLTYLDVLTVEEDQKISYKLECRDAIGLKSKPVISQSVHMKSSPPRISTASGELDRTARTVKVSWKCTKTGATKYLIYRATDSEPLSLYRSVTGEAFVDSNVQVGTSYTYRVKAIFENGLETTFSKPISIQL